MAVRTKQREFVLVVKGTPAPLSATVIESVRRCESSLLLTSTLNGALAFVREFHLTCVIVEESVATYTVAALRSEDDSFRMLLDCGYECRCQSDCPKLFALAESFHPCPNQLAANQSKLTESSLCGEFSAV